MRVFDLHLVYIYVFASMGGKTWWKQVTIGVRACTIATVDAVTAHCTATKAGPAYHRRENPPDDVSCRPPVWTVYAGSSGTTFGGSRNQVISEACPDASSSSLKDRWYPATFWYSGSSTEEGPGPVATIAAVNERETQIRGLNVLSWLRWAGQCSLRK